MEAGRYEEAASLFRPLGDYKNSVTRFIECIYQIGTKLYGEADYEGAYMRFWLIRGYKDTDSMLRRDGNLNNAARSVWTVGHTVTFGAYPQTGTGEDNTPIEWTVLARQGNRALLVSKYALDVQPYNTEYKEVTWEKCSLRAWLNKEFLDRAFTAAEQQIIANATTANGRDQGYREYKTKGGNNTQDKVFLLSYAEAWRYFGDNSSRVCALTDYAAARGADTHKSTAAGGSPVGSWWLRSPGGNQYSAMIVLYHGSYDIESVRNTEKCVRPALWVTIQ